MTRLLVIGSALAFSASVAAAGELMIISPPSGSSMLRGETFSTVVTQQVQTPNQGASTLQFSNDPAGPWVTARDNQGPLQAETVPWTSQYQAYSISTRIYRQVWVRVGVWYNQGPDPQGPPDLASDPVQWSANVQSEPSP